MDKNKTFLICTIMKNLKSIILVTTVISSTLLHAATINFDSTESIWENSSGFGLQDGSQILIGTFDTSSTFDFNLIGTSSFDSYAEVLPFFTQFGSDVTQTLSTFSGIQQGGLGSSTSTGSQIYFWAFNDQDFSNATEWAIVGNTDISWQVPADTQLGSSTSINLGVLPISRVIEFGSQSTNLGPTSTAFNVQTALIVPEPSTYAFFTGFLTLGYVFVRRRAKS